MPVFDASALNDNAEALAFLRAVLTPPDGRATLQSQADGSPRIRPLTQPQRRRSASGIPLIVGVAVSIMTAA